MFAVLSKIIWAVVQPVSVVLILLVIGLVLSFTRWRKTARLSLALSAFILALCAFTTFGYMLLDPLEQRFVRPEPPPSAVTGIIVLGGGMDTEINTARGGYELNRSGDRFVETVRLAAQYPDAKVVMTGGGSVLITGQEVEADAAKRMFAAFGIPEERLVFEDAARNTEENAQLTRDLLNPQPGDVYLLVTSAFHMPRSVGLFRRAGFDVIPWPADYLGAGDEGVGIRITQPAENLAVATIAIREWIGLLAYWMTGRIDQVLPGPQ